MNRANVLASLLGMSSIGLFAVSATLIAPAAQASGNAGPCLIARKGSLTAQELYNRCNDPVEAAWCHYQVNSCVRFDNTWTINPGEGYPVEDGTMLYDACRGANSIARIKGIIIYCE